MRAGTRLGCLSVMLVAGAPAVARAADVTIAPVTRIVGTAGQVALRLHGTAAAPFELGINGRPAGTNRRGRWRLDVPVASVRAWSAPLARDMLVTLRFADANGTAVTREHRIKLPTGLLGRDPNRPILLSAR